MPLVDLTPETMEEIADQMEDNAYELPPGPKRTDMLLQVQSLRSAANRVKWDDDFVVKAEVLPMPRGRYETRREMKHVTNRTWKPEDIEELRRLVEAGASPCQSRSSVQAKRGRSTDQGES